MTSPTIDLNFPHSWEAELLPARPPILPARHFVYPVQVEEVERGALEVLIRPSGEPPFLATCALGFRDPVVPTGIWSMPDPNALCALSGGYAYIIDTTAPERFTLLSYRPVLQVHCAIEAGLLLFVGNRAILAWNEHGEAWQSAKLSDEGVAISSIEGHRLRGMGWNMIKDKEITFSLDLKDGSLHRD